MENEPFNENQNLLSNNGTNDLYEAAKWAKFLGIVGLFFIFMMLIAAVFLSASISAAMEEAGSTVPLSGAAFSIIYIFLAALYIYPVWTFFKFGNLMRSAIRTNNASIFNEAIANLKNCFKFLAMLMILMMGLYILSIVFLSIGAAFS
ncbi:MAG: hypothetical protein E6Q95_03880 [Chitinophagaceae bacterium]|nr:MAG: hypothetical protein E6Q95_03880 [Chitinophagaceae bacterium]